MRILAIMLLSVLTIAGCARTSVIPLSSNEVQVLIEAAPACGATGAQDLAFKTAAITTLQRGFTRFTVNSSDHGNRVVITPDIIANKPQTVLTVRMFRESDPGAEDAIEARPVLGPDWKDIVAKGPPNTC